METGVRRALAIDGEDEIAARNGKRGVLARHRRPAKREAAGDACGKAAACERKNGVVAVCERRFAFNDKRRLRSGKRADRERRDAVGKVGDDERGSRIERESAADRRRAEIGLGDFKARAFGQRHRAGAGLLPCVYRERRRVFDSHAILEAGAVVVEYHLAAARHLEAERILQAAVDRYGVDRRALVVLRLANDIVVGIDCKDCILVAVDGPAVVAGVNRPVGERLESRIRLHHVAGVAVVARPERKAARPDRPKTGRIIAACLVVISAVEVEPRLRVRSLASRGASELVGYDYAVRSARKRLERANIARCFHFAYAHCSAEVVHYKPPPVAGVCQAFASVSRYRSHIQPAAVVYLSPARNGVGDGNYRAALDYIHVGRIPLAGTRHGELAPERAACSGELRRRVAACELDVAGIGLRNRGRPGIAAQGKRDFMDRRSAVAYRGDAGNGLSGKLHERSRLAEVDCRDCKVGHVVHDLAARRIEAENGRCADILRTASAGPVSGGREESIAGRANPNAFPRRFRHGVAHVEDGRAGAIAADAIRHAAGRGVCKTESRERGVAHLGGEE